MASIPAYELSAPLKRGQMARLLPSIISIVIETCQLKHLLTIMYKRAEGPTLDSYANCGHGNLFGSSCRPAMNLL